MKIYELKIYPHPILRKTAAPVAAIDKTTHYLIKSMSRIMHSNKAIGLAATQVGVLKRVVVVDTGEGLISMINPEILSGFGKDFLEEGCLSLPDMVVHVGRMESVFVKYIDKNEKEVEREFRGLTARVIQHEVDHLEGILMIDRGILIGKNKRYEKEGT